MSAFYAKEWGGYTVLHTVDDYYGVRSITKSLICSPHVVMSMQAHEERMEVWTVVRGCIYVEILDQKFNPVFVGEVKEGETVTIPVFHWHRFSNFREEEAEFIEVQFSARGECSESDIYRLSTSFKYEEPEQLGAAITRLDWHKDKV